MNNKEKVTSVLIVDDSKYIQKVLIDYFKSRPEFEVVGVGNDGNDAVRQYEKLCPDLVLMDITMPNKNGPEAVAAIMEIDKNARIVIVSASKGEIVVDSLMAGAKSFVCKPILLHDKEYEKNFLQSINEALDP